MTRITQLALWLGAAIGCLATLPAAAQSFRVQCPTSTITHPDPTTTSTGRPPYNGPTTVYAAHDRHTRWAVPTAGT